MRYENLSDEELIRYAYLADSPIARAIGERLEMRLRDLAELEHLMAKQSPDRPRTHPDDRQLELF